MASTTELNGVDVYVTETDGDVTFYIREDALTPREQAYFEGITVETTLRAALEDETYPKTGRNAWSQFSGAVQSFDPTDPRVVLQTPLADVGETYDQAEVQSVVDYANALNAVK